MEKNGIMLFFRTCTESCKMSDPVTLKGKIVSIRPRDESSQVALPHLFTLKCQKLSHFDIKSFSVKMQNSCQVQSQIL